MKTESEDRKKALCAAVALLDSPAEATAFLTDLCTPQEITAFAERWAIARLLAAGGLSYREIAARTGASTTTISRVARFVKGEFGGYQLILERMEKNNDGD